MTSILLVEDNETNRDMLQRRLSRKGYTVHLAEDGLQAVQAAKSLQPDVILMDMNLPHLDGWEATRQIRADAAVGGTPIIALTANALLEDRQRAIEAGCDAYETKPVDMARLLEQIDALLSREL